MLSFGAGLANIQVRFSNIGYFKIFYCLLVIKSLNSRTYESEEGLIDRVPDALIGHS